MSIESEIAKDYEPGTTIWNIITFGTIIISLFFLYRSGWLNPFAWTDYYK